MQGNGPHVKRRSHQEQAQDLPPRQHDRSQVKYCTEDQNLIRSIVRVDILPATISGSRMSTLWRGMLVRMPPTMNSSSAQRIRAIASSRVAPCVISLASMGS